MAPRRQEPHLSCTSSTLLICTQWMACKRHSVNMCPWTQFPKPLYSLPQRRTGLLAASWNPYPLTSQVSACNYHPQPCPSPLSLTWVYPQTVPTVQSSGSLLTRSCLCWAHCYALTHILMAPLFLFFYFFCPSVSRELALQSGFLELRSVSDPLSMEATLCATGHSAAALSPRCQ